MTHQEICAMFEGASDFEYRTLRTGEAALYAYFVDGLVSGGIKPRIVISSAMVMNTQIYMI